MRLLCIFLITLMLGCAADPASVPAPDSEATERAIRAQWEGFIAAWEDQNAAACANYYTEDARHIPPNSAINVGRNAIAAFYETLFLDHIGSKYTHTIKSLDVGHAIAIEEGQFEVVWMRDDSTTWSFSARSHAHWVREDDQWLIRTFIFNLPRR